MNNLFVVIRELLDNFNKPIYIKYGHKIEIPMIFIALNNLIKILELSYMRNGFIEVVSRWEGRGRVTPQAKLLPPTC